MCEIIFILFEVPKLMWFKFSLKIAMSDIRRSKKVPTLGKKICHNFKCLFKRKMKTSHNIKMSQKNRNND